MSDNYIKKTKLPGLFVIERPMFPDKRGFFREAFRVNELEEFTKFKFETVQWNHSMSLPKVIRGLHVENWNKIVYPTTGEMISFFADIRPDSPTFAKIEKIEFNGDKPKAMFVSKGIANSICVTGNVPVHYFYLVDAYYDGKDTSAVAWDDPDLAIDWPIKNPIISDRDKRNPTLRELFPDKFTK
ncbi:dTDP-4-dehydrorhamnose 3,5-epimerase family protein [Patescibacteria group bacterium]